MKTPLFQCTDDPDLYQKLWICVHTKMYWELGRKIVEEEQQGKDRAKYKEFILVNLAKMLLPEFGSGYSYRQLAFFRQLYYVFPNVNALRSELTWTHYRFLLRIENQQKREFYEAESGKNKWSSRQLERQINSQLFERLILSNDPKSVLTAVRSERICLQRDH